MFQCSIYRNQYSRDVPQHGSQTYAKYTSCQKNSSTKFTSPVSSDANKGSEGGNYLPEIRAVREVVPEEISRELASANA